MRKTIYLITLITLLAALAACTGSATPTPAPPTAEAIPTAAPPVPPPAGEDTTPVTSPLPNGGLLISELMVGVPGNNNYEYIELYNAGPLAVELEGWSLWYLLADNQEAQLVYEWSAPAGLAGYGHYLLAREGEDVGTLADVLFSTPLAAKGALILRDAAGEDVDVVGWGSAPAIAASPALAPDDGRALERQPGGPEGNWQDNDDDAADFALTKQPNPQNSGALPTPAGDGSLVVLLDAPAEMTPGTAFDVLLVVENQLEADAEAITVLLPVPAGLELLNAPAEVTVTGSGIEWTIDSLISGDLAELSLTFQTPWTYTTTRFGGYYAATPDGRRAYGEPRPLAVGGGAIPIAAARTLPGQTVTIEGIATMYTGGFFAGTTGTKFYLEDETGGIQVYVPGGMGTIEVQPGDQVRVTGGVEVYRDSLEIVPDPTPEEITIVQPAAGELTPPTVPLAEAASDAALLGRLITTEGTLASIQENSFDYTMDLVDEAGNSLLLLLEKDTGVDVEPLLVGENYRVTGIAELYASQWQLKPRRPDDFAQIFPPVLRLDLTAPNNVLPGELLTVTLHVANHTPAPLTNVLVTTTLPAGAGTLLAVLDDGTQTDAGLAWTLAELPAGGGTAALRYTLTAGQDEGAQIDIPAGYATASEWPEAAPSNPARTFLGAGVPIWAIQGSGAESPYTRQQVATAGVVTGVFPELGGFWLQEPESDADPATSAGLFVLLANAAAVEAAAQVGDAVTVAGRVREISGQTTLDASGGEVVVQSQGNPLPAGVELDPPADPAAALAYYEALEGMLVQVTQPALAVQPSSQYGEYALVRAGSGVTRIFQGDDNTGLLIFVDDGSSMVHDDITTLPYAVTSGDEVGDLLGPLAYTFDLFKIEPIITPTLRSSAAAELPSLPLLEPGEFSIATFNAENFFDATAPHPSSPPPPDPAGYALALTKAAATIEAMGFPTVVALQEIENIDILADLAATDLLAPYGYQPALIEGFDSRGIDVGYLVRGDQATLVGAAARPGPGELFSRPPLLITVTLHLAEGDQVLYVLNNHFLSLSGGEAATEPTRTAQAAWNVTLLEEILAREPDAWVAVLGDLNSFYDSLPLDTLRQAGLRHVYEFAAPERLYSYIFEGQSETLDHMLLSPALYEYLVAVDVLHVNADYPPPIPDDPSPRRSSDHDPLVARFRS